jgi:hypothetical protein
MTTRRPHFPLRRFVKRLPVALRRPMLDRQALQ